jgi:chromosome segregation ATPase
MSPASGIDDSQLREVKESLSNILDRVSCLEACSSQAAPEQYQEVERRAAELGEQVSAGLSELMKHQQELTAMKAQTRDLSSRCTTATSENGNSSSRYQMPPELEEGLDELTKQVAAELSELRDHQRDLTQAKDKMINVSKVFDEVDRMSGLVADELQELRIHQEELRQAKAVMARNEGVAAPSVDMQQGISDLEDKVEILSAEVISELQALATHQEELRCTKANLRDIAEQVDDDVRIIAGCQKAVLNVKEDVELLRTQSPLASPKASPRDKSTEDSSPAKLAVNELRTSPKSGVSSSTPLQPAGIIEDHVSEVSESYDNDAFDEEDEASS